MICWPLWRPFPVMTSLCWVLSCWEREHVGELYGQSFFKLSWPLFFRCVGLRHFLMIIWKVSHCVTPSAPCLAYVSFFVLISFPPWKRFKRRSRRKKSPDQYKELIWGSLIFHRNMTSLLSTKTRSRYYQGRYSDFRIILSAAPSPPSSWASGMSDICPRLQRRARFRFSRNSLWSPFGHLINSPFISNRM